MLKSIAESVFCRLTSALSLRSNMFYAVSKGRQTGIFSTWSECEAQVKGFAGAKYKKFSSQEEAESFVAGSSPAPSESKALPPPDPTGNITTATSGCFYAVAKGKKAGIYSTWLECKAQVEGLTYAKYRKFTSLEEAQQFIHNNSSSRSSSAAGPSSSSSNRAGRPGGGGTLLLDHVPPTSHTFAALQTRNLTTATYSDFPFSEDPTSGHVHCYTDGACEKNGRVGARAGIGVFFGLNHPMNVSEPVSGPATNNVAEIEAATKAIRVAQSVGIAKLQVNTDSQFLISCVTEWMPKWRRNGWKLSTGGDVKNRLQLTDLQEAMDQSGVQVKWNYVKAHCGIDGNEEADRLAKAGAARYSPSGKATKDGPPSHRYKPY